MVICECVWHLQTGWDIPHNTDDEDVHRRIAKWAGASSGTEHIFFAICLNDTVIGYSAFNKSQNGYEVGYCFHSVYHGKGYAKESHIALLDYLHKIGITKFNAGTAMNNTPSVSLLKALGFELIGTENVSFYKDAQGNDIFLKVAFSNWIQPIISNLAGGIGKEISNYVRTKKNEL